MIIFRAVEKGLDVSDNLDEAGLEALDKAVKGEEMGRNFRKQETENEKFRKRTFIGRK